MYGTHYSNISPGSVAMHLRCGGTFNEQLIANFLRQNFEICQYLMTLRQKLGGVLFLTQDVHMQ